METENVVNEKVSLYLDTYGSTDLLEDRIWHNNPDLLKILLIDRTRSDETNDVNIIWGNKNYLEYGAGYDDIDEILPELITGDKTHLIMPRVEKTQIMQKERTKSRAEVFTPLWIVKKQNDALEEEYLNLELEDYINKTWLEITCGEAPYIVTRYDMENGKFIPIPERQGFLDRKIQRINKEINDKEIWTKLVENAYKASYGFEWNGDSLLLARENLLASYFDYYYDKWQDAPEEKEFIYIANIISYNIFQMDGLNYCIPLIENKVKISTSNLFEEIIEIKSIPIKAKIMNWQTNKMEYFCEG